MGGGYSDLNIYFKWVYEEYSGTGYKVNITRNLFGGCSDFHVITHNITVNKGYDPLYYNVILFNGSNKDHQGEYVFGYYYPNNPKEVLASVSTYYSVLEPNDPLVISFTTKGQQTYNCLTSNLIKARWNYSSYITENSFGSVCHKKDLVDAYTKISRRRKIRFINGNKSKLVTCDRQIIDKEFYRYIYRPEGDECELASDHLFSFDSVKSGKPNASNKINDYYLSQLNGKLYDGIMVYFKNDIKESHTGGKKDAVLLEFIETSKEKVQFIRKDKEGDWWAQEKVQYNNDTGLSNLLKECQKCEEVVTVIIDKKNFDEKDFVLDDKNKSFNKYTHNFGVEKKPVFIFERQKCDLCGLMSDSMNTKKVEVYNLKTSSVVDKEPFLVLIHTKGDNKKVFYFSLKYQFKDWKEFDKPGEIQGKLDKLNQIASCIQVLSLLRWYAYQILIGKEPSEKEIKDEAAKRPPVKKPPDPPVPLPTYWIIGGSVGGGVFVISSAALYGVYWYNTTIKLLT